MKQEIKKIKKLPPSAMRQAGLTLIELTIVLLILIGLSGLLLPFVQGFIDKTHDSANSDSLKEVSKIIQEYGNLYSSYPEDLESLAVGTAGTYNGNPVTAGAVIPYAMRTNLYSTRALVGPEITQLENAGISKVMTMLADPGAGNYTLKATEASVPVSGPATVTVINEALLNNDPSPAAGGAKCSIAPSTAGTALTITAAAAAGTPIIANTAFAADDVIANQCLAEMLGKTAKTTTNPKGEIDVVNNDYIVMGIGNDSSLIGRVMNEAPIHFAKVGGMNAANKYNHILAVFEVRAGRMDKHPAARFVGTLMPMMKLEGLAQAQASYYKGDGA